MSGRIILTADDYALTAGVSQAIRLLAAADRISATSAIVTRPRWPQEADALKPLAATLAIGLHLNLTLGAPLGDAAILAPAGTMPGIGARVRSALFGQLNSDAVSAEIHRQLDAFEAAMGVAPDFIDGHQHVHVLPVVRSALLAILASRYGARPILVRDPSPTNPLAPRFAVKGRLLRRLARHMRRDVEQAGFQCNDAFGGLTSFDAGPSAVAREFGQAAALVGWRPIVMCHPGFPDAELERLDPHTTRRQIEFDVLMQANNPLALNAWHSRRTKSSSIIWPALAGETAR
jgi:chitin disaccharide deacetylase